MNEESIEIEKTNEGTLLTQEQITIHIPDCCKYGYETCPHVIKKEKAKKQNIGL